MSDLITFALFLVGLLAVLLTGIPIAFAFGVFNIVALFIIGGMGLLPLIVQGMYTSITSFIFVSVPLFILVGTLFSRTTLGPMLFYETDKLLDWLPGRLGVVTLIAASLFGAISGVAMATCALFASLATPELLRRGYPRDVAIGTVLGASALDILIPPSALAIIVGAVGGVSVSALLMAIIGPGVLILALFTLYVVVRCFKLTSQSEVSAGVYHRQSMASAGSNTVENAGRGVLVRFRERLLALWRISPLAVLMFAMTGTIYFGVATPTEAAAFGVVVTLIMAWAMDRSFTLSKVRDAVREASVLTGAVFLILVSAAVFSQILAFTNSITGMVTLLSGWTNSPLVASAMMVGLIAILGCFLDPVAIILITVPLFIPVLKAFDIDQVWFFTVYLAAVAVGSYTPPFGVSLFVFNSVHPNIPTMTVYRSAVPFIVMYLVGIVALFTFPGVATWLPLTMGR